MIQFIKLKPEQVVNMRRKNEEGYFLIITPSNGAYGRFCRRYWIYEEPEDFMLVRKGDKPPNAEDYVSVWFYPADNSIRQQDVKIRIDCEGIVSGYYEVFKIIEME